MQTLLHPKQYNNIRVMSTPATNSNWPRKWISTTITISILSLWYSTFSNRVSCFFYTSKTNLQTEFSSPIRSSNYSYSDFQSSTGVNICPKDYILIWHHKPSLSHYVHGPTRDNLSHLRPIPQQTSTIWSLFPSHLTTSQNGMNKIQITHNPNI